MYYSCLKESHLRSVTDVLCDCPCSLVFREIVNLMRPPGLLPLKQPSR